MQSKDILHCIGDSHASFFSGRNEMQPIWPELSRDAIPFLKSYRLGPVLAYNLCKLGTTSGGREKLFGLVKTIPANSRIMLVFGEIDIRVHLLKQAKDRGKKIEEIVGECISRYMTVVLELKIMGFEILIFEAMPSTLGGSIAEEEYAAYGTCEERNDATRIFNEKLREAGAKNDLKTISIFDELVLKNGLTDMHYYSDKIHLAQKVMPLFIKKLKIAIPDIVPQLFKSKLLESLPYKLKLILFKSSCHIKDLGFSIERFWKFYLKVKLFRMYTKLKNDLSRWRSIIIWIRAGKTLPPPHSYKQQVVKQYRKKYKVKYLVETGTFMGEMIAAVKDDFEKFFSIELDHNLAEKARSSFAGVENVKIYEGDSGEILSHLVNDLDKSTLFWLDAHYSAGVTARGDLDTPIIKELDSIFKLQRQSIILIDDARLFIGANDYPILNELREYITGRGKNFSMEVKNDIIRIILN